MRADCYNVILASVLVLILITQATLVRSVYQFSKSQALRLSQVRNHSDFLRHFVRKDHGPRQGSSDDELAEFVGCQVKEMVVPVTQPASSDVFYWPLCTMARRCSGCCYTGNMKCLPLETQNKPVKILIMQSEGEAFDVLDTIEIQVEEHVTCGCQCSIVAQDCNDLIHTFNQSACACECKRTERCQHGKIWDSKTCSCLCQNTTPCSHGNIFDVDTCRCEPDPSFRETNTMQHYLRTACRKTCPQSQSLTIPQDSCFCT